MLYNARIHVLTALAVAVSCRLAIAQQPPGLNSKVDANATSRAVGAATVPPGYVIGVQDLLSVVFWREKDMSAEVTVRPDGKISLPLLNEVQAAGYTPEQLRLRLEEAAGRYIEEPTASVVVKEIHSRTVFVTGGVNKPGAYPLVGEMTVLQLIALAGGLAEYSDTKNIRVIRTENGRPQYFKFNYNDVIEQKNVEQNIDLRPGDTVVVK